MMRGDVDDKAETSRQAASDDRRIALEIAGADGGTGEAEASTDLGAERRSISIAVAPDGSIGRPEHATRRH